MNNFADLVAKFIEIISLIVPIIFALTFVVLAWGIIKAWIINGGDENSVEEGKKIALAGVIALVIMFGIWGILAVLRNSLF
ncbi:MAG: hypothetical protein ACI92I_000603 [Acidimicrobiales bacterium]|jgi:hypothetical protein